MGLRGPSPKPTALRILQGNPGKLKINRTEPKPPKAPVQLEPPAWLNKEGRETFRRLRPDLPWLTVADIDLFAGYCNAFARWREAEDFLTLHGMMFVIRDDPKGKDDKGAIRYMQSYPQVAHSAKYYSQMVAAGRELGLSPASRTRIKAGDPPGSSKKTPAEEMFG
jgi:P27 family predicted phage terminase small subunit